jgi:hypothetical protein
MGGIGTTNGVNDDQSSFGSLVAIISSNAFIAVAPLPLPFDVFMVVSILNTKRFGWWRE